MLCGLVAEDNNFSISVLSKICSVSSKFFCYSLASYLITLVTNNTLPCCSFFSFSFFLCLEDELHKSKQCDMTPNVMSLSSFNRFPEDETLSPLIFVVVYYCTLRRRDTLSSSVCDDTCKGSCITTSQAFFWLTGHNLDNLSP